MDIGEDWTEQRAERLTTGDQPVQHDNDRSTQHDEQAQTSIM